MVKFALLSTAFLAASFIFLIAGIVLVRGAIPFLTDNLGIGRVSFAGTFLTGDVWLDRHDVRIESVQRWLSDRLRRCSSRCFP
ncbi:MAG: hypothetical protein MZU97_21490 [Bacillus subtilis]|nr:hypothetical protein [Bacillus subtilis]